MVIAENIRRSIENENIILDEDHALKVTGSIGISSVNFTKDKNIEVAIRNADDALYTAKHGGFLFGNRIIKGQKQ